MNGLEQSHTDSPGNQIACAATPQEQQSALNVKTHQDELRDRYEKLSSAQSDEHRWVIRLKRLAILLFTLGTALLVSSFYVPTKWAAVVPGSLLIVLAAGCLSLSLDHSSEERRYYDEVKEVELACDLLQLVPKEPTECKAEKMLGNNDFQLRRYYELNLEQCSKIFWVGLLCLVAGGGVIAGTLYAVYAVSDPQGESTKIILGVVGAVGSILINYVGAVFLKMHSEILATLKEFQNKLVVTQELYLASVLAARIHDGPIRHETLKALSCAIAERDRPERERHAAVCAKEVGTNGISPKH